MHAMDSISAYLSSLKGGVKVENLVDQQPLGRLLHIVDDVVQQHMVLCQAAKHKTV